MSELNESSARLPSSDNTVQSIISYFGWLDMWLRIGRDGHTHIILYDEADIPLHFVIHLGKCVSGG